MSECELIKWPIGEMLSFNFSNTLMAFITFFVQNNLNSKPKLTTQAFDSFELKITAINPEHSFANSSPSVSYVCLKTI